MFHERHRWSYLNQLNNNSATYNGPRVFGTSLNASLPFLKVCHQTTFLATTYHRRRLYDLMMTKLTRKSFFRRKHFHNWLIYQNILSSWSREYLFFRRYARSLLALYFYRKSYLFYNLLIYKGTTIDQLRDRKNVYATNLIRGVSAYCNQTNVIIFPFIYKITSSQWFYTSLYSRWSPLPLTWLELRRWKAGTNPAYLLTDRSLSTTSIHKKRNTTVFDLFTLVRRLNMNYLVEFYKLTVLLVFWKGVLRLN
jgi:hypothetical protein